MKPIYTLFLVLLLANNSYSQHKQSPDEADPFVNGFAKVLANDKWSFIDKDHKPVGNTGFESVRNFVNGLAAVKQQGKWGFINQQGAIVIPADNDIAYDFTESVTAVYKNNKWSLINKQGTVIKPLSVDIFRGYKNGVASIISKGRQGTMNTRGDIVSLEAEKIVTSVKSVKAIQNNARTTAATCPANIGFEAGSFVNWSCFTGTVEANGSTNVITVAPSAPIDNRHTLYASTPANDLDQYGLFPVNPPDGSGYAVRLGNNINGAEAERITYQINVPANSVDASISYRYAVVFEDPGHESFEQPRFIAKVLDVETNTYLPCASYEYISTSTLPGFNSSTVDSSVKYKAWSSVFINLSRYAGKSLVLEFTTADCTKGKHWGYAYVDVGDCDITAGADYQCNPNIATFTGPPGFMNYRWWDNNFGTLLGTGQNLVLNPAPAIHSVHVEVIPFNGFGCSDTLNVSINPKFPIANAGFDKAICTGGSASVGTAPITGLTYSWSPGITLTDSSIATPVATIGPVSVNTYVVTATSTLSGCSVKDTVVITVNPKPVPLFNTSPDQCLVGNHFSFTNATTITGSFGLNYTWSFNDGDSSTIASPAHNFTKAGTFNVKLNVISTGGCIGSITHPVTVFPNPTVRTNDNMSICLGKTAQLQASGAQTYTWAAAASLSCTDCANPIATPVVTSQYTVKGINATGCPGYDTIAVTVYQPIDINVSPDKIVCDGEVINLQVQANGSAATYKWSPATGLSSTIIPNPIASPNSTIRYRVVGYDTHQCFTDTGYVQITVNPTPSLELGPDLVLSTGTVHTFAPVTSDGPISSWRWTPPDNLSCSDCGTPTTEVKKNITYHARVENTYGCTAVDSISIRTFCKGSQVFVPNAFTPDGDGLNDILIVRAKGISLVRSFRVFSRWGELVFEKTNFPPNDANYGWDGRIKGIKGAAEVYVYTAEVVCDNDQVFVYKGNTTILK
jgi:gliding motility-associated-like protein